MVSYFNQIIEFVKIHTFLSLFVAFLLGIGIVKLEWYFWSNYSINGKTLRLKIFGLEHKSGEIEKIIGRLKEKIKIM